MADAQPSTHLLDVEVLSRIGPLELIAKRVVEGYVTGRHRSPYKGGCVEFAHHRPYSPGDEVRLLDWRAYARSDRYYIKQFEQETNLQVMTVLDASGSMGFAGQTVSKFRYAQIALACLARLMLQQRDAVGLGIANATLRRYIPARSTPLHFQSLIEALQQAEPAGETALADCLHELAQRIKRRSLIVIASDGFDDVDELLRGMHHLRSRGYELLLLHTLAPEEITFNFGQWSRFECLEVAGRRIDLDPAIVRKKYLERFNVFLERLQQGCSEVQCDYVQLATDQPLGETLAHYLARRSARR